MDKYLDVMLTTSGDVLVDDKDELDAAYQSGELTEEQYEAALSEEQRIIDEWGKDIHATELLCKEMLNYIKTQVNDQPLTIDITPYGEEYHSRTDEINAYLHMHPNIERYVILDDCYQDDYSCDLKLREHLVFVDALKCL